MLIFLNINLGHRDDILTTGGCVCPASRLGGHLGHRWVSGLLNLAWRSVHPIARCGGSFFSFCLDGSSELLLDDEHVTTPAQKKTCNHLRARIR